MKVIWWIIKLFALVYGKLFPHLDYVILPTLWGYRFIIPKKGFSKYLLLNLMLGLYEVEWKPYFDSFISSAKFFIDVGAAADGYYSFRAIRNNKQVTVIAIEPLQLEFNYLVKNIWINRALGRIIPLKLALGECVGEALIEQEKVPVLSLDELIKKLGISRVDVIKIDVEGAGLSIIKGALETISRYRPVIFIEVHNQLEASALIFLSALSYIFIVRERRVVAIPRDARRYKMP